MTKLSSRLDSHGFSGWMDEGFRQKPPPSVWSLAVDVSGWVLQLDGPRTWLNFTAAEKSSRGCGILGRTRDSVETSTSGLLKGYGMYGSKSPAQVTKFKPSTWVALDDWPLNEEALGPGSGVVVGGFIFLKDMFNPFQPFWIAQPPASHRSVFSSQCRVRENLGWLGFFCLINIWSFRMAMEHLNFEWVNYLYPLVI